jgi:hypothetical protein
MLDTWTDWESRLDSFAILDGISDFVNYELWVGRNVQKRTFKKITFRREYKLWLITYPHHGNGFFRQARLKLYADLLKANALIASG